MKYLLAYAAVGAYEGADQPGEQPRHDGRLAAVHDPDAFDELLRRDILRQKAGRSGPER